MNTGCGWNCLPKVKVLCACIYSVLIFLVSAWRTVHFYGWRNTQQLDVGNSKTPGAGVTGSCEPTDVCAGNWTQGSLHEQLCALNH